MAPPSSPSEAASTAEPGSAVDRALEVDVDSDHEEAIGQHRAVGTLLTAFGGCMFVAALLGHYVFEVRPSFLTTTDAMLISLAMVLVGDVTRRWTPDEP